MKVDSTEDVKGDEKADENYNENKLVTVEEGKSEKETEEVDLPVVEIGKGKDEFQREVMNDDS